MEKVKVRDRFKYWFDNQMAKGSMSLIKLLALFTVGIVIIISFVGYMMGISEGGVLAFFWDSVTTVINAWMPYYDDGDGDIAYLILMSIAALMGLLVTSVLIGIVSSAIEEKITSLKQGTSIVLENNHVVVLGFTPGEYTLIKQLIISAEEDRLCLVIGADMDSEEMKELIADNVDIPKNVKLICRKIDIYDPASLRRLSLDTCRTVIISPTDDLRTTKAILAVSSVINSSQNNDVRVNAIVSNEEFRFPESAAKKHNVTTLKTKDAIAKIIAHSCTQPGLSETFREIFNFEGSELYDVAVPEAVGMSFEELSESLINAVPIGILRDGVTTINPERKTGIEEGDRLLVFSENGNNIKILDKPQAGSDEETYSVLHDAENAGKLFIIGCNDSLKTILNELPENVDDITIVAKSRFKDELEEISKEDERLSFTVFDKDINAQKEMEIIAKDAEHIILLSDYELPDDDADMKVIFRIMNLRDIRERYDLDFNITAEMRKESNQALIEDDDHIDFVVSTNMSSMILAQLAESPMLIGAYNELLSNKGNEFYLKKAKEMMCSGTHSVGELRRIAMAQRYIFIGYNEYDTHENIFNPGLEETINLRDEDRIIVIGED